MNERGGIYVGVNLPEAERAELFLLAQGERIWIADPDHLTADDRRAFVEAEIAYGFIPVELVPQAGRLRWIQLRSAGVDRYAGFDWSAVAGRIVCTNAGGIYADAMAQTLLGGLLALTREIAALVRLQGSQCWQKGELHQHLVVLDGAGVLFLGAGHVNRRVRELLAPFGCAFTFFGRTSGDIHTLDELDRALPGADIVCAALPDTPVTRGLIGRERIARFKPGAIFINAGRGSLLDEAALIDALRGKRLGGAVLDVTRREPLPPGDPLWTSPRTILTQHSSGGSTTVLLKPVLLFGENLARFRAGKPLLHVVDWKRGY